MPKIKLEGMEKLQVKLKKNVQMSDVKRVVKENGKSLQEAAQLAAAAEAAIRAKAQIHSPARVTDKLGNYFGIGWINGIMDHVQEAKQAAMELIQIPELTPAPEIGMSLRTGSEDLNDSYQYSSNGKYTIYVPVNLDGREIGKATATYTREEIEKQETRENRKKGRRMNV